MQRATQPRPLSGAQALLLSLARDEPPVNDTSSSDWSAALGLAARHGIAPLLHEEAQAGGLEWIPETARRELRAARIAELSREEKRQKALVRALAVLADGTRVIPALLLKGAASARTIYGHPELRPRSDLDLLIAPADREEALARLAQAGYAQHEKTLGTREDEADWHERTFVDPLDPGQQIDLHFALSQTPRHRLDAERLLFASAPEPALGAAARMLPPEEAALVCAHSLAIHELAAPLISLCDLSRLLARCDPLRLSHLAAEVRLVRALHVSVLLLAALGPPAHRSSSLFARAAPCGPFSLCGARVEPALLAGLRARSRLSIPADRLLRAAALGYDLDRAPLPRARQLWRKALFIDHPADAARFAARHALQTLRRAGRRAIG